MIASGRALPSRQARPSREAQEGKDWFNPCGISETDHLADGSLVNVGDLQICQRAIVNRQTG